MDEKNLVKQAQQGDESAFAQLIEENQKKVYRLAYRMTGNHEDALDISQEAFFKAWRALPNFKGESSFSTWIYRLTSNSAIDLLRKQQRQAHDSLTSPFQEDEEGTELQIPAEDISPEDALIHKEMGEMIAEGLEVLSPTHKEVLLMREMDGLSYQEISTTLGLDLGTVKSRIARGRKNLRDFLCQKDEGDSKKKKNSKNN
ncbi:MAG: sigma-70 family RNA polymerase sigma factor [Eubacteriales bacterium]